ncbi:MAG: hypothetical protein ACE5HA_15435 [Anaerolineae bacterium]
MRLIAYLALVALIGLLAPSSYTVADAPIGVEEMGRLDIPAKKVVLANQLLYAIDGACTAVGTPPEYACRGSLSVLQVLREQKPVVLGQVRTDAAAYVDADVSSEYAYVLEDRREVYGAPPMFTLAVMNISEPATITPVTELQLPGPQKYERVEAASGHLYVSSSAGINVYRLTERGVPVEAGQIDIQPTAIDVTDSVLYVTGQRENLSALFIFSVSDPGQPEELGVVPGNYLGVSVFGPQIVLEEEYTCTDADNITPYRCGEVLVELDATDLVDPVTVYRGLGGEGIYISSVARSGGFLLVGTDNLVRVLDLNNAARAEVAQYVPEFGEQQFGSVTDLEAEGGSIFAVARIDNHSSIRILRVGPMSVVYLPMIRR